MLISRGLLLWLVAQALLTSCYFLFVLLPRLRLASSPSTSYFGDFIAEMSSEKSGLRVASCEGCTVCLVSVLAPSEMGQDNSNFETQWSRRYDHTMYSLAESTTLLGGSACVRSISPLQNLDFSQCANAKHFVLFGVQLLENYRSLSTYDMPSNVIVYNLEPTENLPWFTEDSTIKMLKKHQVWDFSSQNLRYFSNFDIQAIHVPVGYSSGMTYVDPPKKKKFKKDKSGKKVKILEPEVFPDIDVLMIGTCNARRSAVLKALTQKGLKVRISTPRGQAGCSVPNEIILPPVYGLPLVQLFKRTKIVLCVHFFETRGVLDIQDISYYLANSKFVISETGSDKEAERKLEGGLIVSSFSLLVENCIKYSSDNATRSAIAEKGQKLISQYDSAPYIRCPLMGADHVVNTDNDIFTSEFFAKMTVTSNHASTSNLQSFEKEFTPPPCFRVVAIMSGFNVADIIFSSINDLLIQGVDVHFIDNWSTDSTVSVVRKLQRIHPHRITSEKFPKKRSRRGGANVLERKRRLASHIKADWIIFVRPNSLLESPWGSKVSLRRAFFVADQLDFNLIDFGNVMQFHYVSGPYRHDGSEEMNLNSFTQFSKVNRYKRLAEKIAWKTYFSSCFQKRLNPKPVVVEMSENNKLLKFSNAEEIFFPGHRLFPFTFNSREYPFTSQSNVEDSIDKDQSIVNIDALEFQNEDLISLSTNVSEKIRVHDNGAIPYNILSPYLPCQSHPSPE